MEVIFIGKSGKNLKEWQQDENVAILKRNRNLIEEIQKSPFEGIGKPEPLKSNLRGK
jgi:toxin YoeB